MATSHHKSALVYFNRSVVLVRFTQRISSLFCCCVLGSGGPSAVAQARTLMVEMGAPPVPYVWYIPEVNKKLDENGKTTDERQNKNAAKFITQLNWYGGATKAQREKIGEPEWGPTMSV